MNLVSTFWENPTHVSSYIKKIPYDDPRYSTSVLLKDPKTRERFRFTLQRFRTPVLSPILRGSDLLDGLRDKPWMVAAWLCDQVIFGDYIETVARIPVVETVRMQRFRRQIGCLAKRVRRFHESFDGRLEHELFANIVPLRKHLSQAASSLEKAFMQTVRIPTIRAQKQRGKAHRRAAVHQQRAAVAFALYEIYRKFSDPLLEPKEIHRRIGEFQIRFLGHSIEPHITIPRQISRFKKQRRSLKAMQTILELQLNGDWFPE